MERSENRNDPASNAGADSIQGEGDYRAARAYRENVEAFVEHADIEKAARAAAPLDPQQARELEGAEEKGRSHARDGSQQIGLGAMTESLAHAVRRRPVTAIVLAGALGYFLGRVRSGRGAGTP